MEELLKKERDVRVYRRIKVIYLLKKTPKIQLKDVSEKMDISIQSVKKYWRLYKKGGIENLKLKYKGRIPRLNKEEFEKFKEKAKEGFDSLKSMQEWIKKEFNKELSIKTISETYPKFFAMILQTQNFGYVSKVLKTCFKKENNEKVNFLLI